MPVPLSGYSNDGLVGANPSPSVDQKFPLLTQTTTANGRRAVYGQAAEEIPTQTNTCAIDADGQITASLGTYGNGELVPAGWYAWIIQAYPV
jgi:LDH2 family malate/lactate/ureidoglycolate dehydrogenase